MNTETEEARCSGEGRVLFAFDLSRHTSATITCLKRRRVGREVGAASNRGSGCRVRVEVLEWIERICFHNGLREIVNLITFLHEGEVTYNPTTCHAWRTFASSSAPKSCRAD